MSPWRPLYRRELQSLFYSPVAYLVTAIFLVLSGYYFYSLFTLYALRSAQAVQTPTLAETLNLIDGVTRPLFVQMGVLALLVLPLLTMRQFAEEKKVGTLELLLSYPVREWEVVLGKFLATATVYGGMLLLTYPLPLLVAFYAQPDWGAIAMGYLGLVLMGVAFIAVGLFVSTLTEHQVVAGVVSLGLLFFSWLLRSAKDFLSGPWGEFLAQFSILYHQERFAKGVFYTLDFTFYVVTAGLFLFLTWYSLAARRWGGWWVVLPGGKAPALVLGVVVGGLISVQILSSVFPFQWDMTRSGQFSLSPATLRVLKTLDTDVQVTAFGKRGSTYYQKLEDLLALYAYHSPHWHYTLQDPDQAPSLAERYGATGFGILVVIEREDRKAQVRLPFEDEITGALLKVIQEQPKTICFSTGHGEHDPEDASKRGYLSFAQELQKSGYRIQTIRLLSPEVLEACDLVVIGGGRGTWLTPEQQTLEAALVQGKAVLLLLEPGMDPVFLRWVEAHYPIQVLPGVVVDRTGKVFGGELDMPVAARYGSHRVTRGFTLNTFYPSSVALRLRDPKQGVVLVETGEESWLEQNPEQLRRQDPRPDPGEPQGPLTLALVGSTIGAQNVSHRWAVVGDSDFVANAFFGVAGNGRLAVNLVNWLTEDEALILTQTQEVGPQPVFLTSQEARTVFYLSVLLFPAVVLGIGGGVLYWRWR